MNIIDIVIILLIILSGIVGFKRGVLKEAVFFIGTIIVYFLAFNLKNPLANFLCKVGPFFEFRGIFEGLSVLNILIYHIIAFVIIAAILYTIFGIILKITGIIQKLVDLTIIFTIPSKILGFVLGLLEGYVVIFLVLMVLALPLRGFDMFRTSTVRDKMMNESPLLSTSFKGIGQSIQDIYLLVDDMKDEKKNKDELNKNMLDILLKNKLIDVDSANETIKKDQLKNIDGLQSVVDRYK